MSETDINNKRIEDLEHNAEINQNIEFNIGDKVRYLKKRKQFGKIWNNYSKTIYTIIERIGNRYKLNDKTKLISHNRLMI